MQFLLKTREIIQQHGGITRRESRSEAFEGLYIPLYSEDIARSEYGYWGTHFISYYFRFGEINLINIDFLGTKNFFDSGNFYTIFMK